MDVDGRTANHCYNCYEMDKTSICMFEILEPGGGGSALGKYSI